MFDAINSERAFSNFFGVGDRDLLDAAVFRGGDPKNLGEIVESFARRLAKRIEFLEFVPDEAREGGAKPRLEGAIRALVAEGKKLKQRVQPEPEDEHW